MVIVIHYDGKLNAKRLDVELETPDGPPREFQLHTTELRTTPTHTTTIITLTEKEEIAPATSAGESK